MRSSKLFPVLGLAGLASPQRGSVGSAAVRAALASQKLSQNLFSPCFFSQLWFVTFLQQRVTES